MYEKSNCIPLTSNASYSAQNLSLMKNRDSVTYAVISRNSVNLVSTSRNSGEVDQKLIIPKISKDETTGASNGPDTMLLANIVQTKFVEVSDRSVLVICATKGIFFYDDDCATLMYFHNFRDLKSNPIEETTYGRGITTIGSNSIAIGTSSASILIFEVPPKGNNIALVEEITEKNLSSAITDLVADEYCLVASDTNGNIFAWQAKSVKSIRLMFAIRGNKNSCTSLGLWKNYLISGYGNGLVSIFNIDDGGKKLVDISAHARWIHCLDVAENAFVTAGEDCHFRVWELGEVNGRLRVNALHSELMPDTQITGISFNKGTDQICASIFDCNEILVYNSL